MKKKAKAAKAFRQAPQMRAVPPLSWKTFLLLGVTILLIFLMICLGTAQKHYDLSVGAISHYTINASKDVIDRVTTEERKQAAAAAVDATYRLEESISQVVLSDLKSAFDALRTIQQYGQTLSTPETDPAKRQYTESELNYARSLLPEGLTLSNYQLTTLLRASNESFNLMVTTVTTAVENTLATTIREGQVAQAITSIQQIVGYKVDTSLLQNIVPPVLRATIRANMVVDQELTQAARQRAMDAVEDVICLQGQNIIREGEIVTAKQMHMLSALGLLSEDELDWPLYLGIFIQVVLIIVTFTLIIGLFAPHAMVDLRRLLVMMISLTLTALFTILLQRFTNTRLAPVSMGVILLTILSGARAGIAGTVSLSLLLGTISLSSSSSVSADLAYLMITSLISGTFEVAFLRNRPQRVRIILCGLLAAVITCAVSVTIRLMSSAGAVSGIMDSALYLSGGAFLGSLAALVLQPVMESIFNLATPSKLLELANPNQPLLRRLLLEAPGTYHHSIIVANLAEAAAERIGANPLLCRTAAYFHDIGKLKRPLYFKENQIGDNPHDRSNPFESAAIVKSHTTDGVMLAQQNRLPLEIQQVIRQHHGDTPVMYFYHKALQQSDGRPVRIEDFRYAGQRPDTKEAAIIMLADTVEAAIRALPDPTPELIEKNIIKLVRSKMEDGQLSNSPLTLHDIDEICIAFAKVMSGVFHERIEYPKVNMPSRENEMLRRSMDREAQPDRRQE